MAAASEVAAVLGKRTNTQILLSIIQAVMVDMVDEQMVRNVGKVLILFRESLREKQTKTGIDANERA